MTESRPPAVWFTEEQPRKPRLSRDRIARGAVALLDAEGVAGLSMRRLAARLNAGAMSLYEYVGGKEDVLDLALDAVMGEIELDGAGAGGAGDPDRPRHLPWRDALTRQLVLTRDAMKRHPWLPALMATRPLLGPNSLARSEYFYSVLDRAGLEGPRLTAAVGSLTYYVQGYAATENVWRGLRHDPAQEAELRERAQRFIDHRAADHPALARHAQLANSDFDGSFTLGLETILDGIEAQLSH
ncbi:TetR/AcrR family transcriptional regulator [Streptomyces sp. NBC_01506]|uniref:TetR/AcrR family transcriptional regulator n=1 Tax=Streptomyces sp. NBC_01506 TaxID=2903887 RepID=UPI00386CE5C4